jgi:hypothetical protein
MVAGNAAICAAEREEMGMCRPPFEFFKIREQDLRLPTGPHAPYDCVSLGMVTKTGVFGFSDSLRRLKRRFALGGLCCHSLNPSRMSALDQRLQIA